MLTSQLDPRSKTFRENADAMLRLVEDLRREQEKVSAGGGAVTLSNGAKIVLPANGVVKAAGGAYSGTINVYAAYIDPTSSDIARLSRKTFYSRTGSLAILRSRDSPSGRGSVSVPGN